MTGWFGQTDIIEEKQRTFGQIQFKLTAFFRDISKCLFFSTDERDIVIMLSKLL